MAHGVALITGGIGTELCRQLAAQGLQVVASYPPGDETAAQAWRHLHGLGDFCRNTYQPAGFFGPFSALWQPLHGSTMRPSPRLKDERESCAIW
jgi:hypothetical protein